MAAQSLLKETLINELEGTIVTLRKEKSSIVSNYEAVISAEREKNTLQSQNVEGFKSQILSYESENNYLKKRERKARRERNVAIGLGVILLALAVVK